MFWIKALKNTHLKLALKMDTLFNSLLLSELMHAKLASLGHSNCNSGMMMHLKQGTRWNNEVWQLDRGTADKCKDWQIWGTKWLCRYYCWLCRHNNDSALPRDDQHRDGAMILNLVVPTVANLKKSSGSVSPNLKYLVIQLLLSQNQVIPWNHWNHQ